MSDQKSNERNSWVSRVLGVNIAGLSPPVGDDDDTEPVELAHALDDWQAAIETVDAQIEALAQELRHTKVPMLAEIADKGMSAVTKNYKVPLMAALLELRPGTKAAIAKCGPQALLMVRDFRSHIDEDERVEACDDNPLDIPVLIRSTLRPALNGLEQALVAELKR